MDITGWMDSLAGQMWGVGEQETGGYCTTLSPIPIPVGEELKVWEAPDLEFPYS